MTKNFDYTPVSDRELEDLIGGRNLNYTPIPGQEPESRSSLGSLGDIIESLNYSPISGRELDELIDPPGQVPTPTRRELPGEPVREPPRDASSFYRQAMGRLGNQPVAQSEAGGIPALLEILGGMRGGAGESFAESLGRSTQAYKEGKAKARTLREKQEVGRIDKLLDLYEKDRAYRQGERELDIKEMAARRVGTKLPSADIQSYNYLIKNLGLTPEEAVNYTQKLKTKGIDVTKQILDAAVKLESGAIRKAGAPVDLAPSVTAVQAAIEKIQPTKSVDSGDVRTTIEDIVKPLKSYLDIYK